MNDIAVRRLDVTYRLGPEEVGEAPRLERVLQRVTERGLDRALRSVALPSGEWCVRRLDVPLHVRLRDADRAIEDDWATALARALLQALDTRSADLAVYHSRREALLELITHTATGRCERMWAWERIGVRRDCDPSPTSSPAEAIIAALCRAPQDALAVVTAAAEVVGLAALDRTLGVDGWLAVVEIVCAALGVDRLASQKEMVARTEPSGSPQLPVQSLALAILRTSHWADMARRSRLHVTRDQSVVWALLAVLDVEPTVFRRPAGSLVVAAVASALSHVGPPTGAATTARAERGEAGALDGGVRLATSRPTAATTHTQRGTTPRPAPLPSRGKRDKAPDNPGRPSRPLADAAHFATNWAGLLFLHNVAEQVGLPDVVLDDVVLAARPLRWVLHVLAGELVPLAPDDPAALAFAGLGPTEPPISMALDDATPEELDRIRRLGAAWSAAVAERLDDDEAAGIVARLAVRPGRVEADRGWIEVHLDLAGVDVSVRCAGLDIDPGWIPWLGCVVRFVYA